MAHLHSVYDSDMHFSIDPITRAIRNESTKNRLVQYDHNSERFTFELARYIEEHDMSLCNRVEIHYLNIGTGGERNEEVYEVNDWQISPDDNSVVICSWLISANATQLAGSLNFLLRFACIAEDGTIDYAWHTEIYSGLSVSNGMNNSESVIAEFPDVLEAWKQEIFAEFENNPVQSDWNQTDESASDYIKNKPTIPTVPKTIYVVYEDINGNATLPDAMEWYKAHPLDGCYIGSQTGYSEPILVKSYSQTAFTLHMVEYNYWEMDEENYGDSAYWVEIFDSEYITSKIDEHDKQIGNVDKALDSIIAIQNSFLGGESV